MAVATRTGPVMKKCLLIPVFNHPDTIAATVAALLPYNLPIIMVDDGSDQQTKAVLQQLVSQHSRITLLTLATNGGKGAAVSAAIRHAWQQGYSHGLQIDADGQHNSADIPLFWQAAEQEPLALISGLPQYDASMPTGRRIGRQITHFWVNIETLSRQVRDTMLGFRVYPLASCIELFNSCQLGQRMDFDIEIMVRLYWQGVPVRYIPTRVIYPEGGRSHFRMLADNWLITKMHTRLVFGMLWRLPRLLQQRWAG